jgi:hypothetical protein
VSKRRRRLSWAHLIALITLLTGSLEPLAKLITAISQAHW